MSERKRLFVRKRERVFACCREPARERERERERDVDKKKGRSLTPTPKQLFHALASYRAL